MSKITWRCLYCGDIMSAVGFADRVPVTENSSSGWLFLPKNTPAAFYPAICPKDRELIRELEASNPVQVEDDVLTTWTKESVGHIATATFYRSGGASLTVVNGADEVLSEVGLNGEDVENLSGQAAYAVSWCADHSDGVR